LAAYGGALRTTFRGKNGGLIAGPVSGRSWLNFQPDFTVNLPEFNTISCPWHHNIIAAVGSFWAAKSLRRNPGSRNAISSFQWLGSEQFK
tara:strand:- start:105 stop:374 length:270 start_codon:yes stop_codon:yes gene_type:complete